MSRRKRRQGVVEELVGGVIEGVQVPQGDEQLRAAHARGAAIALQEHRSQHRPLRRRTRDEVQRRSAPLVVGVVEEREDEGEHRIDPGYDPVVNLQGLCRGEPAPQAELGSSQQAQQCDEVCGQGRSQLDQVDQEGNRVLRSWRTGSRSSDRRGASSTTMGPGARRPPAPHRGSERPTRAERSRHPAPRSPSPPRRRASRSPPAVARAYPRQPARAGSSAETRGGTRRGAPAMRLVRPERPTRPSPAGTPRRASAGRSGHRAPCVERGPVGLNGVRVALQQAGKLGRRHFEVGLARSRSAPGARSPASASVLSAG